MTDRPIIMSGHMVLPTLDGTKTHTRRTAGLDAINEHPDEFTFDGFETFKGKYQACFKDASGDDPHFITSPYGKAGDTLWVRENFWIEPINDCVQYFYMADHQSHEISFLDGGMVAIGTPKWKPSIHMPRTASRIDLEIINLRIERLQDISDGEAVKEGAVYYPDIPIGMPSFNPCRWSMKRNPKNTDFCMGSPRMAFANFINELHGGKNWNLKPINIWDKNPYVWVVVFKRIRP